MSFNKKLEGKYRLFGTALGRAFVWRKRREGRKRYFPGVEENKDGPEHLEGSVLPEVNEYEEDVALEERIKNL